MANEMNAELKACNLCEGKDKIKIFLKRLDGDQRSIQVSSTITLKILYNVAAITMGLQVYQIRLVFRGAPLNFGSDQPITQAGISPGDTIHIILLITGS